jgi:hypothetical protein
MQDDLDSLIDRALAGYSAVEPLTGIEGRVIERARIERAARRRKRVWWMAALAAPGLAAMVFVVPMQRPAPPPAPVARIAAPVVVRSPAPKATEAKQRVRPRPVVRQLPKRDQFPTYTPLTREERMLLSLAASNPEAWPAPLAGEIEIKPIEIAPLQVDDAH